MEDIGQSYAKFGHSQLLGRVVGLLLCEDEPLSIDQICESLEVTKTPVNQICKRLEELKLIKRVWVKGDRKHHYQIVPDVFLQAANNQMTLYEENLKMIAKHLHLLLDRYSTSKNENKEHLRIICKRFINMHEFHEQLIKSYNEFIAMWEEERKHLPQIDEYIEKIETLNN
jgi:DNA-binding transcriptional regulator GbsR (MarR family)